MKINKLTLLFFFIISSSAFSSMMLTESFNGSDTLVTPGNTGDHTGATFTFPFMSTVGSAQIAFDVSLTVGGGPVHFDTRGFGDSGNTNDSFQRVAGTSETMVISIGAVTATALSGSTLVSNNVVVTFDSFDLVQNGDNTPTVDWTTDIMTSGTTATAGGGSGVTATEAGVTGATQINLTTATHWMWINNAQFSFVGDVVVETVPEPSTVSLGLLGSVLLLSRRKR